MEYPQTAPLSYGNQPPLTYYVPQKSENPAPPRVNTPSSIPAGMLGVIVGAPAGLIAARKNPHFKNGTASDTFVKTAYDKYVNKFPDKGKEGYDQTNEVLKKIDKIKNTDELKTLLSNNKKAADEISTALNSTTDEFLSNITDKSLSKNKKTIKEKLKAANTTRFQEMENYINSCWDAGKKKLVKPDNMDDDLFKVIKKTNKRVRAKAKAKYAGIAAAIGGVVAFVAHKIYIHTKMQNK